MAVAGAVSIAVLMGVYVAKMRRKETRFGCVHEPLLLGGGEGRDSGAKAGRISLTQLLHFCMHADAFWM